MVKLLLVRSVEDMTFALKTVSEFLIYQPLQLRVTEEDLLAIWVKGDLDAHLPAWFCCDLERPTYPVEAKSANIVPVAAELGIRQSFGLSDVWMLCWIDGPLLHGARSSAERRDAILRTLVDAPPAGSPGQPGGFFPVFDADEPAEIIEAAWRDLRGRYPHQVGVSWFLHDKVRGIVPVEPPEQKMS